MIEVEIKARVNDFNNIKETLDEKGAKFIKSVDQTDKIFGLSKFLDSENKVVEGGIIARIREKEGKKILEFKEISRQKGGIELKFEISDIDSIKKFLSKLDFKEAFTVKKTRELYSYKNFTICLDIVYQLGKYIEIEKMVVTLDEKEKTRDDCLNLLKELAPISEIENRKYGDIIQEMINKDPQSFKT